MQSLYQTDQLKCIQNNCPQSQRIPIRQIPLLMAHSYNLARSFPGGGVTLITHRSYINMCLCVCVCVCVCVCMCVY